MEVAHQEKAISFLEDHYTVLEIDTDEKCIMCLKSLCTDLSLEPVEVKLIDSCLKFLSTNDDEIVEFGLGQIFELCQIGIDYPEKSSEIMACVDHINKCIDYETEYTEERYEKLQNLWNMMTNKNNSEDEDSEDEI